MTSNLPPLSRFVQVFEDTLVKSVHQRHVAGVTLTLPGGNQPEALAAVTAVLDALEQALRVHTVSMILITASILCALGMLFSSAVNRRWHNPTQRIPIYLATFDVIGCGLHLADHVHTMITHQPFSPGACRAIGTIFQFWTGTQVVMVTFLAINVGLCAQARKSVDWGRWDAMLLVPTFLVSVLLILPGIIMDAFGSTGYWCFIRGESEFSYAANILYRLVVPTIGVLGTCTGYGLATYEVRKDVRNARQEAEKEPPISPMDPYRLEMQSTIAGCPECDADSTYEPDTSTTWHEQPFDTTTTYTTLNNNNIQQQLQQQQQQPHPLHHLHHLQQQQQHLLQNNMTISSIQSLGSTPPTRRHSHHYSSATEFNHPSWSARPSNAPSLNHTTLHTAASLKLTAWQKAQYQPHHRICRHHRHAAIHYFTAYLIAAVSQWTPVLIYTIYLATGWTAASVPLAANSFFLCSGIAHYAVYASLGRGNTLKARIGQLHEKVNQSTVVTTNMTENNQTASSAA